MRPYKNLISLRLRVARAATALVAGICLVGCGKLKDEIGNSGSAKKLRVEYALLLQAPNVPSALHRDYPAHVIVDLEVREVVKSLADGVEYTFWTFEGSVPGPLIRVREGDEVEIHLRNHPSSKLPHDIDLHAVSGPGGGAASTLTAPGHMSTFSFTATNPGLFVYHCAVAPVPMHVGSGMYGMILVEPKRPLPPVDREYYVMQGEFYTAGRYGDPGLQAFDPDKAADERPPYVVFNGAVGSLVGDKALKANTGETIRIFFGVGGPNLISSFHIIGTIFDNVYGEGGTMITQHNVQTTVVPPGGAAIVEFHTRVPGNLTLVDHSLSRAFGKGAVGILKVSGPENKKIYSGKINDEDYYGTVWELAASERQRTATPIAKAAEAEPTGPVAKEIQMARGKQVYDSACFACHQPNGRGLDGIFPPLARSDFLLSQGAHLPKIPLKGLSGPITVGGKIFNGQMPAQAFSDAQIADVLTYVLNSWGNDGGIISTEQVRQARSGPE